MSLNDLKDLSIEITNRKINGSNALLTTEELQQLSRKDLYQVNRYLPMTLGLEVQFYYFSNRQRTDKQLLEETEEEISVFEKHYQGDFETIFGGLTEEQMDTQDDVMNYLDWFESIERKKQLLRKIENETT